MGIFDLFGKSTKPDSGSVDAWLRTVPRYELYNGGRKALYGHLSPSSYEGNLIYLSTTSKLGHLYTTYIKKMLNMPKSIEQVEVNGIDLLKLASDMGHFGAPFILALMYEHGIISQENVPSGYAYSGNPISSQEMAEVYHRLARERGCSYEKAYQYIKENYRLRPGELIKQSEQYIVKMVFLSDKLAAAFGFEEYEFKNLGIFFLAHYAKSGSPYSIGRLVGSLELFHENSSIDLTRYSKLDDVRICALKFVGYLYQMAERGDREAIYTINRLQIPPLSREAKEALW